MILAEIEANEIISKNLSEMADVLEQQDADGFRVSAYRRAAETIGRYPNSVFCLAIDKGMDGLIALPTVGQAIASAILEMVQTGHWSQLDRLRGTADPEALFRSIAGVGPKLARKIHDELQIETLEALESACQNGKLSGLSGIGPRRLMTIQANLAERLGRRRIKIGYPSIWPSIQILLSVDAEYREKAAQKKLPRIAPKRFNPTGDYWLPVLHTERDIWQFTALYSNTAFAHKLGKTNDWVIIYFHSHSSQEEQCTVVTEHRGDLKGKRVVRGREGDCLAHYAVNEKK